MTQSHALAEKIFDTVVSLDDVAQFLEAREPWVPHGDDIKHRMDDLASAVEVGQPDVLARLGARPDLLARILAAAPASGVLRLFKALDARGVGLETTVAAAESDYAPLARARAAFFDAIETAARVFQVRHDLAMSRMEL